MPFTQSRGATSSAYLCFALALQITIAFFAVITLALSVAYARTVARTPLESYWATWAPESRRSTLRLIVYAGFIPFLTLVHAAVDAGLFLAGRWNMLYALVTSVALFLGWLAQAIVWGLCYAENSYGMPVCPEWRLARKYSGGAALARLVFANMLGLAYLASLTLAAIAVHRARKPAMDALGCDDGIRMADRNGRLA